MVARWRPLAYVPSTGDGETYDGSLASLVWSPSGDRVLFTAAQELRQVDVGNGHVTTIAAEPWIQAIRFSPDGDRILFTTWNESEQRYTGLWSIDADGSDMQLLVPNTGFGDWQPHPGSD